MTELARELSERARTALSHLAEAQGHGDDYLVELHEGELAALAHTAREHGVAVPELSGR
ncbi:MAG: hypothetical protein LWW86_00380 [Micrococcales bacterium]|nr:hypothetical protein [Micrococcales bacterium]